MVLLPFFVVPRNQMMILKRTTSYALRASHSVSLRSRLLLLPVLVTRYPSSSIRKYFMPRLSKRRRQLRGFLSHRKVAEDDGNDSEDEEKAAVESDKMVTRASRRDHNSQSVGSSSQQSQDNKIVDRPWVQCNNCSKWRSLPKSVDLSQLPEEWYCELNYWDPERQNCDAEEEAYVDNADDPLRAFFRLWFKRIKAAEKSENRLPPSFVTRGRKRKQEMEWIRCSNPSCGKWRSISASGLDTSAMLSKLNAKGKWGNGNFGTGHQANWFCSMNSWDETTASCAAPQEPLYDTPWSLGVMKSDS